MKSAAVTKARDEKGLVKKSFVASATCDYFASKGEFTKCSYVYSFFVVFFPITLASSVQSDRSFESEMELKATSMQSQV